MKPLRQRIDKKSADIRPAVPIPLNHTDSVAHLSAPVRDLADFLAEIAAVQCIDDLFPDKSSENFRENPND